MAVSALNINVNNMTGDSDLISIHNPVMFTVNATYSGDAPDILYAKIYDEDSVLLDTFRCIPYVDLTTTLRQFMFVADEILRGYMEPFDDFQHAANILTYCDGFTKIFTIEFLDVTLAVTTDIEFTVLHGARQFGQDPNCENIFTNEAKTYIAGEDKPVYVYFYNDNTANVITVNDPGAIADIVFLDFDDQEFLDNDDTELSGLIQN